MTPVRVARDATRLAKSAVFRPKHVFLLHLSQSFSYGCSETRGCAWMAPFSGRPRSAAPFSPALLTQQHYLLGGSASCTGAKL